MRRNIQKKIKRLSRVLFNEFGTANVTTNNIADRMGISPGNLYYHFPNKEKIIRDIFHEFVVENSNDFANRFSNLLQSGQFVDALIHVLELFHAYRFLFRDISYIISRDRSNTQWQESIHELGYQLFQQYYDNFKEMNYLQNIGSEDMECVFHNFWLNLISWNPFLHPAPLDEIKKDNLYRQKVIQILSVFRYYMTEEGLILLAETTRNHSPTVVEP